jgi:hypothetical protein
MYEQVSVSFYFSAMAWIEVYEMGIECEGGETEEE